MNNKPNKELYNPIEVQVFGGMCNRSGVCTINALIMLIFSCPSLITNIVNYINKWCGYKLAQYVYMSLLNAVNNKVIKSIIIEVIETKSMKYFEFVFLLIYIMYIRIQIINIHDKYKVFDLYTVNELFFLCLGYYYYGTSVFNNDEKNEFINIIKRKPHRFLINEIYDTNYFNDFIEYIKPSSNFKYLSTIKTSRISIIAFFQFIKEAASLNKQNIPLTNINKLIGEPIFYHDFHRHRSSKNPFYNFNGAKIILVLNEYITPYLGSSNNSIYYKERFPEFIDIYVNNMKLLKYVLVGIYFASEMRNYTHAEAICRFYNNGVEKYYRISNREVIECGTQEKFKEHEKYLNNYLLTCDNIQTFEPFIKVAVYHAYKWLT